MVLPTGPPTPIIDLTKKHQQQQQQPTTAEQKKVHEQQGLILLNCPKCKYKTKLLRGCLQHFKYKHQLLLNSSEVNHFKAKGTYKQMQQEDLVVVKSISIDQILQTKMKKAGVVDLSVEETEEEAIVRWITKCSAQELKDSTLATMCIKIRKQFNTAMTEKAVSLVKQALREAVEVRFIEQQQKVKQLKIQQQMQQLQQQHCTKQLKLETLKRGLLANKAAAAAAAAAALFNVSGTSTKKRQRQDQQYTLAKALNAKRSKSFAFPK